MPTDSIIWLSKSPLSFYPVFLGQLKNSCTLDPFFYCSFLHQMTLRSNMDLVVRQHVLLKHVFI